MSTRSNVLVKYGENRIYFYRHYDGYLAVTGADLLRKMQEATSGEALIENLISQKRGGSGHDKDQKQYEITNMAHGDIEFFYIINAEESTIQYASGYGPELEAEAELKDSLSIGELAKEVNVEIAEMNQRIAVRNVQEAKNGGAQYDYYPVIEIKEAA